ncbi:MAG TPA: class I SAM-dependent methyltransferase [Ktedonobacteraceae bacterium]|nr:class I SAM-dependent methyltransferase [Ktedonobacteraceae bacterium]
MTIPASNKPHWQDRPRYISHGRMIWYGDYGDDEYWYEYWKKRLTPGYYTTAESLDLTSDPLGSVLLHTIPRQGLHLEAGCGAGYWVAALRHRGYLIEGIEYATKLVELVRAANPELPVHQGDALHIDSPDNHYDSYISIGVVEHRIAGPEPFLTEANRVLKPGGKILLSVPYFGPTRKLKSHLSLYERNPPDLPFFQYGFTIKACTTYLKNAGFSIEIVKPLYPHRMLLEEIPLYRWMLKQPWSHLAKKWAEKLLQNKDGHMLLLVGTKSPVIDRADA